MEILKFGDAPSPKRSNNNGRKSGPMIVAGLMVAMMGMSTTLAGTISIGTNSRVEFGQGLVATAACDDSITLNPVSSFTNSGVSGDTFTVSSIVLSDIAADCAGKVFLLKAFAGSSATSLAVKASGNGNSGGAVIKFKFPDSNTETDTAKYTSLTKIGGSTDSSIGSVGFSSATALSGGSGSITLTGLSIANSVTRFTIESSDHNATNDGTSNG